MINLNTENKLPEKLKWYYLIELALAIFLISIIFMFMGTKAWTSFLWVSIIFIGLPVYLYLLASYKVTKFIVEENKITINSGIILKRSKSIAFNSIQNIENVRGLLPQMLGLSNVEIWTSSPSQIKIHKARSENKPDGELMLESFDADWLKNYILDRQSKQ